MKRGNHGVSSEEARRQYREAGRLYRGGRFAEALSLLDALDQAFPGSKEITFHRALCLWRTGQLPEAQELFDALCEKHGDGPWVTWRDKLGEAAPPEPDPRAAWIMAAIALVASIPCAMLYGWGASVEREAAASQPARAATAASEAAPEAPHGSAPDIETAQTPSDPPVPASVEQLLRDLHNPLHTNEAYAELCQSVTHDHLPLLHRALEDKTYGVARSRVARLLGHLRHHRSVAPLRKALASDSFAWARRQAAWALGRIGAPLSAKDLERAMRSDSDPGVRLSAAAALHEIKGMAAHPLLQEAIQTEPDHEAVLAMRWLLDTEFKGTRPPPVTPGEIGYASFKGTLYKLYVPGDYREGSPRRILVSVHGSSGTPEVYLDMFCEDAEKRGFVVVAPFFDTVVFPYYDCLSFDLDGTRSDLRLLEILDAVAEVVDVQTDRFYLFGNSKGGQFVSRFVLAHPDRILSAAACGSGNYVMPDPAFYFPRGIKPNPLLPESASFDFGRLLQTPFAVVIGTRDLPRRNAAADRFMDAVRTYASQNGLKSQVRFISVPLGEHAGKSNYPAASKFLFTGRP